MIATIMSSALGTPGAIGLASGLPTGEAEPMGLLKRLFGGQGDAAQQSPAVNLEILVGSWAMDIVGESHYQDVLSKVAGGKTHDGVQVPAEAELRPEPENPHDPNAVAVLITGATVGYIARDLAADLQPVLIERTRSSGKPQGCRAEIVGGWNRGQDDEGHFGVKLFLDTSRLIARSAIPELSPATRARVDQAAERVGPLPAEVALRAPSVDQAKAKKKAGDLDEAILGFRAWADAAEENARSDGTGVAPAPFHELAVCYRKQGDLPAEVAILERFARLPHAPGRKPGELLERLALTTTKLEAAPQ